MFKKSGLYKKGFWSWALMAGVLLAFIALLPQIDLWSSRGPNWNGAYAMTAFDEPAYASYLQSIIDGKPRRNSPYSGRMDTVEDPQKESLFSIQFFSTYPLAELARIFGFSSSTAMILLSVFCGFASGFVIFWLIYHLSEDAPLAFVGTLTILLSGSLFAGQGSIFSLIFPDSQLIDHIPQPFLRRTNPAVSFPILFLFFVMVWTFLRAKTIWTRMIFAISAVLCFAAIVYTYFFHWTAALAWFVALVVLWAAFEFDDFRKKFTYLLGMGISMVLVLVPYFILLANRSRDMDSIQLLVFTREPDLWRIPELVSYVAIFLILLSYKRNWLDLDRPKYIFLLSFCLVAPIVFNQQILTGHSLQPFHYELFCVNYISSFVLVTMVLMLSAKKLDQQVYKKTLLLLGLTALLAGYIDVLWGNESWHDQRIWLDEQTAVAKRIKSICEGNGLCRSDDPLIIMSFDLTNQTFAGRNLPGVSSQTILWSEQILGFPDISAKENRDRLNKFIYYHHLDGEQLKKKLSTNFSILIGFFGFGRVFPTLTTESSPITEDEIDAVVKQYEEFRRQFSYEDAKRYRLSFVITRSDSHNDLAAIDRWYDRDAGENVGSYTLYQVKLRNKDQLEMAAR